MQIRYTMAWYREQLRAGAKIEEVFKEEALSTS